MMAEDFFTSGGIGDDNQDGDSRDETFEFWGEPHTRGWEAFDKVLAQGTAPMIVVARPLKRSVGSQLNLMSTH